MNNVSAQDFRNVYERFYDCMRMYLWPYSVLDDLANVEVDIYDTFIDIEKLQHDFGKLKIGIKDACSKDPRLEKVCNKLDELINIQEPNFYARLRKVEEVNPQNAKQIRTIPEDEEE